MAQQLRDGQLAGIIKSSQKLVCVDFGTNHCPPCVALKPWWDSLPPKYPTCAFYSIDCDTNGSDCQQHSIRVTPTLLFFYKGAQVNRIEGADKNKILSTIEKYKPASVFEGAGRTLDAPSPAAAEDFFARLKVTRDDGSKPAAPKPKSTPSPEPQHKQPEMCCKDGVCTFVPKVEAKKEDPEVREALKEMGFEDFAIDFAFKGTNFGDLDQCIDYLDTHVTELNDAEEAAKNAPPTPAPAPKEEVKEEAIVPTEAKEEVKPSEEKEEEIVLNEAGKAMLEELVAMGFEEKLATAAVDYCYGENIDTAIEYITMVQNGEEPPKKKKRLSKEESEKKLAELRRKAREREAAEQSPEARARAELARRKEIQAQAEQREKMERMKREAELRAQERERVEAKRELERVKARIRSQRAEASGKTATAAPTAEVKKEAAPPRRAPATECTLQLLFTADGTKDIAKFKPEQTLLDVEQHVRQNPKFARSMISFETTFPRAVIPKSDYSKTLKDLGLMPRSQLCVKTQ